jgi:hypothetical protein
MATFYSPNGNPEVWDEKPEGYFTPEEWEAMHPSPPPPPPTAKEQQRMIEDAIQARLDEFARTRGYDDILSAATYATDPDPQYSCEGQYAVTARSATWRKWFEILAEVAAGQRPMPTVDEALAELPVLEWPS